MDIIREEVEEYAREHTRAEPDYLSELAGWTRRETDCPQMLTGRLEGRLLKMLVEIHRPRLVFEFGTFTGYSALSMAEGLPDGGRVITCEIDPETAERARAAFDKSPFGDRIEIRLGPALETVRGLDEDVDFSFIDADKANYVSYYEEILKRTTPGGLIVIDNTLWSGRVLDPEEEGTRTIDRLNKIIRDDDRVENVLLTVRDGVQLVRKKG